MFLRAPIQPLEFGQSNPPRNMEALEVFNPGDASTGLSHGGETRAHAGTTHQLVEGKTPDPLSSDPADVGHHPCRFYLTRLGK